MRNTAAQQAVALSAMLVRLHTTTADSDLAALEPESEICPNPNIGGG